MDSKRAAARRMAQPLYQPGDLDGFFGLAIDNLIQFLLILGLCRAVLGFSVELLLARVLPGAALSVIVGNFYYAWQAQQLSRREGPRRTLPHCRTASTRCRCSRSSSSSCCR